MEVPCDLTSGGPRKLEYVRILLRLNGLSSKRDEAFPRRRPVTSPANEKCTYKPLVTIRHIRRQYYCHLRWLLVFIDM